MSHSKVGERLAEAPADEVVEHLYGPRMREERDTSFGYLTEVNRAHVAMLSQCGIIANDVAAALLSAMADLEAQGASNLPLDPQREDLYFNYERAIMDRVGSAVGGQMHTARSRNDLGATMYRMRCRDVLLGLLAEACQCRAALLAKASEHLETVMPGYTHLQPAQPITFAHYLGAIEEALARDTERLFGALSRSELCPLGAGALAGTGFGIDREMTARWLGFTGLVVSTLDAVASRDYLIEAACAGAILGVTLSRFAQDLYVLYTNEFGTIDFPDRVAGTSSIMPQKKNPIVLEHIKGRTAHIAGAVTSALAAVHNANYSNVIDANREGLRPIWAALEEIRVTLALARIAAQTAQPRPELMLERCRADFSTVTELADTLVRDWGISFREAHEVVGAVVREAIADGLDASGITAARVLAAASEVLGREFDLSPEAVHAALDPLQNVRARRHPGGPAPEAVSAMLAQAGDRLRADIGRIDAVHERLEAAHLQLAGVVAGLVARGWPGL